MALLSYTILFLIPLITTFLARTFFSKTRPQTRHLPPGPLALPIIGHMHLFSSSPHHVLCKLAQRYGPIISLRLGSVPHVVVSSPEAAREFLRTHELAFSSRPQSFTNHYLGYGGHGFAFSPYGPYWKFMRKLCMSELLSGRSLGNLLPIRREEMHTFLLLLSRASDGVKAVNVSEELKLMVGNVISRMSMSRRCYGTEAEGVEIGGLVDEVSKLLMALNVGDFIRLFRDMDLQGLGKRMKVTHKRFDEIMEEIVREHEEKKEKDGVKDLMDILLEISEDESAEMKLKKEHIKAFIRDIFVAGTATTALGMEWTLSELIKNPRIIKRARDEIDSVVGKNRVVEESDIPNLPYIQAIVKETLRLHPTDSIILRESIEDCKINGYDIPAKTGLFINIWAIGRDPNYWENPLEFLPERFIDDNGRAQIDLRGQHYHFLPFGSGRRGCPGKTLAVQLIVTTIAAMIQCFKLKIDGNDEEEGGPIDMTVAPGLTLYRAQPLVCIPVARLDPLPLVAS
ncbi:3,9-dihydroxypterocarpan 6A-monooxygenase-like [Magnolia sinica]|uniref:3,9-dihydroxypterocarpan 6A-monooxygenase-like n=1 Tax=Magnolia sinica TaxID=86752 RepID=UPI002659E7FD|nr:3,9-dihydroxypterocarpan 6A-monooxygenase-like [Magnolia sinica]